MTRHRHARPYARPFALLSAVSAALGLAGTASPALAQSYTLTLDPAGVTAPAGGVAGFSATFRNNSAAGVSLNGIKFSFSSATGTPPTTDDSPFFANFFGTVPAGETVTDLLFRVGLPADAPVGTTYNGTVTLQGGTPGADPLPLSDLVSANFAVTVSGGAVVPEPASGPLVGVLLAGGTAGAVAFRRRRRGAWTPL